MLYRKMRMNIASLCVVSLVIMLTIPADAYSEVYKCLNSEGKIAFSGSPCPLDSKQEEVKFKNDIKNENKNEKDTKTKSKNNEDCTEEPKAGWDKATLDTINDIYETRVSSCKETFKAGSPQIKECIAEQNEKKNERMKDYKKTKSSRC